MRGRIHQLTIHRADEATVTTDAMGRWSSVDSDPETTMGKFTPASDSTSDGYQTLRGTAYIPPTLRRVEGGDEVVVALANPRDNGRYRVSEVGGGRFVQALSLERFERKDSTDAQ